MPNYTAEVADLPRTYAAETERKWSTMTAAPSPQARQKLLDAKRRDSRRYETSKAQMCVPSVQERRKMVMEKRQRTAQASTEPDFPLAPARSGNVSVPEQPLVRTNFPTAPQSAGFMPPLESGGMFTGKYAAAQIDTPTTARTLIRVRSGPRGLLPAKRSAPSKTILSREKLAQPKLQARLPGHKRTPTTSLRP